MATERQATQYCVVCRLMRETAFRQPQSCSVGHVACVICARLCHPWSVPTPRDVLERPSTAGGGGHTPPSSSPPPLPMFEAEADSQNFASVCAKRISAFWPAFGGDHRGTLGGGVSQPTPPPPLEYIPAPPPFFRFPTPPPSCPAPLWLPRHGGGAGPGPLTPTPPPLPPPCLEIGWKVPDHWHQRWRKQFCLIWQRVQKCVFTPCVCTQYTRNFQENSIIDKNWLFLS